MTIKDFKKLLLESGVPVYHQQAHKQTGKYIVWAETSQRSLKADGATAETATVVAVDYYTDTEYDETFNNFLLFLEGFDEISVSDCVVDFNPDTGYTRYMTTVEVV